MQANVGLAYKRELKGELCEPGFFLLASQSSALQSIPLRSAWSRGMPPRSVGPARNHAFSLHVALNFAG